MLNIAEMIQIGDLVDFGPYGKKYVCRDYDEQRYWVTDSREDRENPNAIGWFLSKTDAVKILETYEDFYDEDMEEYDDNWYYGID